MHSTALTENERPHLLPFNLPQITVTSNERLRLVCKMKKGFVRQNSEIMQFNVLQVMRYQKDVPDKIHHTVALT